MYTYAAYGLTIGSSFELPELPSQPSVIGEPDVVFARGDVDPVSESVDATDGRRVTADKSECRLTYDAFGSFRVTDGKRVVYDPKSPDVVGTKVVRRLFENEMLGVALHQRGRLVLHASAVSVDGAGAIFLGPRGVGKSTTAAAFHQAGHPILEDDIVSIRFDDGAPVVDPGIPEMRLEPDAVEGLSIEGTRSHSRDGGSQKRYQQFDSVPEPVRLGGCYVLDDSETLRLTDIPERGALFNLVNHTYTQGLLPDTHRTASHFQQCTDIAAEIPFRLLERPKDHEALQSVIDAVVGDLRPPDSVDR